MRRTLYLTCLAAMLSGCAKPQIVEPYATGFSDLEYIVVEARTRAFIGVLFQGLQTKDEKGKLLPIRWEEQRILLAPVLPGANEAKEDSISQVRQAMQIVKTSTALNAATIAKLEASADSAFKFESKAEKFYYLKPAPTIFYNPAALTHMNNLLAKDSNYRFAYMSGLYEGACFAETLTHVKTSGKLSWPAAFEIDGQYYRETKGGIVNAGSIIFQLRTVDPRAIGAITLAPGTIEEKMKPLTEEQLKKLKATVPAELRETLGTQDDKRQSR